jgi:hypothetical protein
MTQEALKLAIQLRDTASGYWTENEIPIIEKLIEILAQTQEPVAWWNNTGTHIDLNVSGRGTPLYTHPPQRTWLGLTDEDISEIVRGTHNTGSFVRAIEAKLKGKNT